MFVFICIIVCIITRTRYGAARNISSPTANLFAFATVIVAPVDSLVILVATFLTLSPDI